MNKFLGTAVALLLAADTAVTRLDGTGIQAAEIADAAGSMQTTLGDFTRFMSAAIDGFARRRTA